MFPTRISKEVFYVISVTYLGQVIPIFQTQLPLLVFKTAQFLVGID